MFLTNFNMHVIGRLNGSKLNMKKSLLYDRLDVFALKYLLINTFINMSEMYISD